MIGFCRAKPVTSCFMFLLSTGQSFDSCRDMPNFDKQPFYQPNAIIAIFYTVAEKLLGSSNLEKRLSYN